MSLMLMTPLTDPPTPPKPGATALAPAPPKACSWVKVSPLKMNAAAAFSGAEADRAVDVATEAVCRGLARPGRPRPFCE